jgi:hypothetical protein
MKDTRLQQRLGKMLSQLSDQPKESIPAACQGWADTQAAYRFLDNDEVSFEDIIKGHRAATVERIRQHSVVLIAQDTTFLTYAYEEKVGFGTLRKTENERYLLHPSVAFTPDRTNLGVLDAKFWQRPEERINHLRSQKKIEEKESYRWLESYVLSCQVQSQCPKTLIVNIADREGDIHEWFLAAENQSEEEKAHFIVRAKCNRRIDTDDEDEATYLWEGLNESKKLGEFAIKTRRQRNTPSREVKLSLYSREITLVGKKGLNIQPANLYAVYAIERKPPKKEKAVEWMLLTSLPAEDFASAQTIVGWYACRWEIEVFFRTLKEGCAIEELRLETDRRLLNCIGVYLIIAWRVHAITMTSRSFPDAPCKLLFTDTEWKAIYLMKQKKKPPSKAPTLREVTRMLAQLGGFLARKGDGEPGVKNVWRGYRNLQNYIEALELSRKLGTYV